MLGKLVPASLHDLEPMLTDDGTCSERETTERTNESVTPQLFGIIAVVTVFGIGHHIDHIVRGNHVGWPLIPDVTPFTYSLLFYPLIAVGLYLTVQGRVGAGYWFTVSLAGFFMVTLLHFGPVAVETPSDVISPYDRTVFGLLAMGWLLGFVASLLTATVYSAYRWQRSRAISS